MPFSYFVLYLLFPLNCLCFSVFTEGIFVYIRFFILWIIVGLLVSVQNFLFEDFLPLFFLKSKIVIVFSKILVVFLKIGIVFKGRLCECWRISTVCRNLEVVYEDQCDLDWRRLFLFNRLEGTILVVGLPSEDTWAFGSFVCREGWGIGGGGIYVGGAFLCMIVYAGEF